MSQFTKKPFTFLADEIFTEKIKSNKVLTGGMFALILLILGLSVIMLSIQYAENYRAELIQLKEMNQ